MGQYGNINMNLILKHTQLNIQMCLYLCYTYLILFTLFYIKTYKTKEKYKTQ